MSNIKDKKVPNVPNLRFPNYHEEWTTSTLGKLANFSKGKGISKDELSESGTPCILYGELYTTYKNEAIDSVSSKTDICHKDLVKSEVNDVIIPSSGETAIDISTARCVRLANILLGGDLNIIKLQHHDGSFISYQFNGARKLDIAKVAQGSSVVHLYNDSLKKLKVCCPKDINEEYKIVQLLDLLNERIATQNKIIEDLKKLRDGIVDRCFCDKGLYPAGEKLQLSEILIEGSKKAVNTKQYKKITIKLHQGGIDFFPNDSRKMTDTRPFYVRKKDEIIIGKQNYFNGSIALITEKFDNTICSNAIMSFSIKNCYDKSFIFLCLSNKIFLERREFLANGTGQKELSENDFLKFVICIPPIDDQLKISKTINSLSLKILQENAFMHFLTKQKQYLLQNMFV